jgi:hypothetical protein
MALVSHAVAIPPIFTRRFRRSSSLSIATLYFVPDTLRLV